MAAHLVAYVSAAGKIVQLVQFFLVGFLPKLLKMNDIIFQTGPLKFHLECAYSFYRHEIAPLEFDMTGRAASPRPQVREFDISELHAFVERVRAHLLPALGELIAKLEAVAVADGELQFGGIVKAAQKLLELDDTEMARTLNVSRPTISRWIRDISSPHPVTRKAICETLIKRARSRIRLLQD